MKAILIPFLTILLAEFGDKTQLAVLCMSAKTKRHIRLLVGVILGFALVNGVTILFGNYVGRLVPVKVIKVALSLFLVLFGSFLLWSHKGKENGEDYSLRNPFWSGFSVIFLSEIGDKTQIASALFAARYQPILVFIGVMLALSFLSGLTVHVGKKLSDRINQRLLSLIAGSAFIIMGIMSYYW
jgi:Ca2+/H+ antiporter, TMEM165/GDT1 family